MKESRTDDFTKGDFARLFYEVLGLQGGEDQSYFDDVKWDDPNVRYIASMHFAFPAGHWSGKQWYANQHDLVNREMVLKSYTIFKGYQLCDAENAGKLLLERGLDLSRLSYSRDSAVYLATLLQLDLDAAIISRNGIVTRDDALDLLSALESHFKDHPEVSVRASNPTYISNRSAPLHQAYYQDGPIENQFQVKTKILDDNYLHQYCSIVGSTELRTQNTQYGIGIWGDATSYANGAKVAAGFFTVTRSAEGEYSQIVGQEIDVMHMTRPGQSNEQSSVGLQIVTIGNADSTAAIEVISDHKSGWRHGFMIDEGAMASDGIVVAVAQTRPMKIGVDLGNSIFTDAAIRVRYDQIIKFEPPDYQYFAAIYLSHQGRLQLKIGQSGLDIQANDSDKALVSFSPEGDISLDQGGLVLTSPGGVKFRIVVDDSGNLTSQRVS